MAFLTEKEQKLDEAQGISVDEIRGWLEQKGWSTGIGRIYGKRRNDGSHCYVSTTNELSSALSDIAGEEGMSLQGLLKEINPRMRRGWPSDAALAAHKMWVVRSRASLAICKYWPCDRDLMINGEHVSCWPCDDNGNKVRWPTNEAGEML
jgi:hypothetical protein